ncbi:MAG TPA: response regulator [Burkholderiaceae bacterium]
MDRRVNILVVDDEAVVRLSLARTLSGQHCNVQAAPTGNEALRMMGEHSFDIVVLDLRMPGMDGMRVLETIKQRWPDSEVIILTGYPAVETAKQSISLGAYAYLAKPVGPEEVIEAANGALLHKGWALRRDPADQGALVRH